MIKDTRCNMNFSKAGMPKCHTGTDDVLTPSGDTDTVSDPEERMAQKILVWMTTTRGERFDPKLGCIMHEWMMSAFSDTQMKTWEYELKDNLTYNFPEYTFQSVTLTRAVLDDFPDTETLAVFAIVNQKPFSFVVNGPLLAEFHRKARQTLVNSGLLNISKTYGF